jgi:hypothetical protein
MQIQTLLDGVNSVGPGPYLRVNDNRTINGGPIALQLSGITVATVVIEGSISTQEEIDAGTAEWTAINLATWTADVADGLFTSFPYIRGNVTAWTSGIITLRVFI